LLHADTVQYSYDAAGRLTTATYSNGTVIAYSYDKAGNLLRRSITGAQSSSPQISA
jgi:YD repeat-containing protein